MSKELEAKLRNAGHSNPIEGAEIVRLALPISDPTPGSRLDRMGAYLERHGFRSVYALLGDNNYQVFISKEPMDHFEGMDVLSAPEAKQIMRDYGLYATNYSATNHSQHYSGMGLQAIQVTVDPKIVWEGRGWTKRR